jgi:2-dehydro-3-deoxyphosphooctonate aldolase (KDO 8-P synthase)
MICGMDSNPPTTTIGPYSVGQSQPLLLIAGPCVIESTDHTLRMAEAIAEVARRLELPFVFKASYDKANRSSVHSYRGPGLHDGLAVLGRVRKQVGVPVLSDIHERSQAEPAGRVLDCVQVPAFLCRQTDLLVAAARTGKCVNIKKGQFVAPDRMRLAVQKVREAGNNNVMVTERGTTFGYERLVSDFTGLQVMRRFAPVVYDATHSVQMPCGTAVSAVQGAGSGEQGAAADVTGGAREFIPLLARAAVAAGVDALFMEVHDDPPQAKSDAANQWPLDELEPLLVSLLRIRRAL